MGHPVQPEAPPSRMFSFILRFCLYLLTVESVLKLTRIGPIVAMDGGVSTPQYFPRLWLVAISTTSTESNLQLRPDVPSISKTPEKVATEFLAMAKGQRLTLSRECNQVITYKIIVVILRVLIA